MYRIALISLTLLAFFVAPARASERQTAPSPGIVAAAQTLERQRLEAKGDKSVGRKDVMTVDITGAVAAGFIYTGDDCGYGGGGEALVLWLNVKGSLVSVACLGATDASCRSTHPGQRIRVQGVLTTVPDVTLPGFNACDQSTWLPSPANFLYATKVTK